MGPMYYLAYELGSLLLDADEKAFGFEMSWDWVAHTFVTIWQPMLLGCVLLGAASAVAGYITLNVLWRISVANYKSRKRKQRSGSD